jgi:hypothetical protein
MKRLLPLFLLFFATIAFAQQRPIVYKTYLNNQNKFIIDNLILSSDSLFFFYTSCECGKEYYGKGKWHIKRNKLYLDGFDSTKAFPNATVDKIDADEPTDSVTIKAFDYFGKPTKNFVVELIYKNTSSFQSMPQFADKTGNLTVSKKEYSGFFLIYETQDETGLLRKNDYHYRFDENTKEIIVHFDFAAAGFDRKPIPTNYGRKTFIIGNRKLLGKRGKTAFVEAFYDD